MIPNKNTDVTVQSNMAGLKPVSMGISAGAEAHIITLLTDLYGDQIMAVIREYGTNARDAMIEAGIFAPIRVTLPTHLSPLYVISDSGVGLDRDEIERVYSQYGASTKRDSNDVNGMMGLGSKSALTYTNQFTIVSVKDNIRTTALVSRVDDDLPTMTVVDESRVIAPNGTEIQVPVHAHDIRHFESEARHFFSFWDEGQVLINDKEPDKLVGLKVGDDMMLVPNHTLDGHRVVMGGVSYPIPSGYLRDLSLPYGTSLVAHVPIGSVDIAPSRENLMTTSTTKATLLKVGDDFLAAAAKAVQAEIDRAESHFDALRVVLDWSSKVPGVKREDLTYKGESIPRTFGSEGVEIVQVPGPYSGGKLSAHSKARFVNAEIFQTTVFVYGYDRASFTAGQKKKLNQWVDNKREAAFAKAQKYPDPPKHFVLLKDKPETPYIPSENIVSWAEIDAIKLHRNSVGPSGRIPGSYDFYEGMNWRSGVLDTEIDVTSPIYYLVGSAGPGVARRYAEILDGDFTLVVFQERRLDKFLRNFPQAIPVQPVVEKLWAKLVSTITPEQKLAMAARRVVSSDPLLRLDISLVDDPSVKEAADLLRIDLKEIDRKIQTFRFFSNCPLPLPAFEDPMDRYPLALAYSANRYPDHVVLYMNAVYAAAP